MTLRQADGGSRRARSDRAVERSFPLRGRAATSRAHLVEVTAINDPDGGEVVYAVTTKYGERAKHVEIVGLNGRSAAMHGKLTGELAGSH